MLPPYKPRFSDRYATAMNDSTSDPLWDLPALARFLGLSPGGLRNMLGRNPAALPPPVRIGRRVRWRPDTVNRWLADRETTGSLRNLSSHRPRPRGRPRSGGEHIP